MRLLTLCLVLGVAFLATANAATDKVFCYYGSWANYRKGDGQVKVEDLNANLCTHLIYTFLGINQEGDVKILDQWLEVDLKALERFVALKKVNPNLKVLIAIGGWNQGSAGFTVVAKNPALRAKFVQNAVAFVKQYGFDGFDLDWEYPARNGGAPEDKVNFIEMIKELRAEFNKHNLLLTAAVGATKHHREPSYDVKQMSQYLDFINIMAYDLHYQGDGVAGFNAPLHGSSYDKIHDLNVDEIVKGWIEEGADPQKLVLGLGLYGRSFKLSDPSNHVVGAPTNGPASAGKYTGEAGSLSYLEICSKIKFDKWVSEWDEKQKVPYAYNGNEWVGYDNVKSLDLKVDLAKKYKLGGVMVWSIEQDDIRNICKEGHYPLLTAINKRLGLEGGSAAFVPPTSAPSTRAPSTQAQPGKAGGNASGTCNASGFASDLTDCSYFYQCLGDGSKVHVQCPGGTLFDKNTSICNYANLVKC